MTVVDGNYLNQKEKLVTRAKLMKLIEYWEEYNLYCKLFRQFDADGLEIPLKYRGRKRYQLEDGINQGPDGEYYQYYLYDMDPEDPNGKVQLAIYVVSDSAGQRLQTEAQIQKHIKAAQMEYDRQMRMEQARPDLARTKMDVKIPKMKRPEKGKRQLAERIASEFKLREKDSTVMFEGRDQ